MADTYLIHSNRQHLSDVDFPRLFSELGVAATYGPEEYGEQLRPIAAGDRILFYDQPSSQYIAAGTVTEPWDGSAIRDPDQKVIPNGERTEYHVSVNWSRWYNLTEGYDRETVNRALDYPMSYAPPRTVSSADSPDENNLDRVYTAIVQNEILGPSLTANQLEILEQWREVVQTTPSGAEFDLEGHNRTDVIPKRADEFTANPTPERFKAMWNQMHSAIQGGQATQILNKWSGSIDDLASLIEEIRNADQYDAQWEDTLGGRTTVRELFGSLHIDDHPILNAASTNGLTFFGYEDPSSYVEGEQYFDEFLATYERRVGYATRDADHGVTVPIRFEVDQLFNIIDKVDEESIEAESSEAAIKLYKTILETKQEPIEGDSSVYWVTQNNSDEIENEYLEASVDDVWHHDLTMLNVGDTVIHYHRPNIIGYSTVTTEAFEIEQNGESRYQVDVDFEQFDEPRPIDDVRDYLMRDDVRGEKYYPLDSNGDATQTYLSRLTDAAAQHILEGATAPDYYWITANPDIWSIDSIDHGGEVFYTATNSKGNRRRIVSAFESASPGDRVVFYESNPVKAIVAEGTIVEGLHEETKEKYGGKVEGVTIQYDRRVEPITWEQLTGLPDLEEASPIRNRAQGSLFQLSPDEYETILALEELAPIDRPDSSTRYFWVNAETFRHEAGATAFYATIGSSGSSRLNLEAYKLAQPGDKVLLYQVNPTKAIVAQAHVSEGLHEEFSEEHGREVEGITIEWDAALDGPHWAQVAEDPELAESEIVQTGNNYVITELTEEDYDRILELGTQVTFSDHTDDLASLSEGVTVDSGPLYFPEQEWMNIEERVQRALESGNHVLLFGPPGTGKTKLARQVCEATVGESNYEIVTASADWSTFDTVGGYQTTAENTLEFQPGVVLDRFQADTDGTPANEWLIIDELNRADIDKAFGSLFSALTGESVTLPFDGSNGEPIEILDSSRTDATVHPSRFYIPSDWRMLATMNTLDKTSLYEMSYAFMRRWAFIPIGIPDLPTPEEETADGESRLTQLVGEYVAVWSNNGTVPEADQHYEPVGRLWYAVNKHRAIGPAIIEDIYTYVASTRSVDDADYVSPIIMYVFPQLEGLRRGKLEEVLDELNAIVADDQNELWTTARDFFQVDLDSGSE